MNLKLYFLTFMFCLFPALLFQGYDLNLGPYVNAEKAVQRAAAATFKPRGAVSTSAAMKHFVDFEAKETPSKRKRLEEEEGEEEEDGEEGEEGEEEGDDDVMQIDRLDRSTPIKEKKKFGLSQSSQSSLASSDREKTKTEQQKKKPRVSKSNSKKGKEEADEKESTAMRVSQEEAMDILKKTTLKKRTIGKFIFTSI